MLLDGPSCFPSLAKVKLHSDRYVRMSDLEVGDQVQAGKSHMHSEILQPKLHY